MGLHSAWKFPFSGDRSDYVGDTNCSHYFGRLFVAIRTHSYSAIPDLRLPFDDPSLKRLIPGCQLKVSVQDLSVREKRRRFEREPERGRPSVVVQTYKVPKVPEFPKIARKFSQTTDRSWEKLEFLEIGPYSFIEDLGGKGKEGFVRRRSNCGDTTLGILCTAACGFWMKRWLFLKENFLALIDPSRGEMECVLLLDKAFRARHGKKKTGHPDYLIIENLNRKLIMQCESERQAEQWAEEISFALERGSADFVTPNRFQSFAPPRSLSECKWIVDGATYFESVALVIDAAKEEIFIADWWLTPEIYLRRPTIHGHYWQLDYLLRRKAREGVRIYVLLYKELELALGINSLHSANKLSRMHPNIQVLRHPQVSKGVLLWAHHEKIVCIDQTHAFVGGLDLCYGRWDDYQHRLTDLGSEAEKIIVKRHLSTCPRHSLETIRSKRRTSSLPDISRNIELKEDWEEGTEVVNEDEDPVIPKDTQGKKKFVKVFRKMQATKLFEGLKRKLSLDELTHKKTSNTSLLAEQPADLHRTCQEIALTHLGLERMFRLWHGKDYVNFIHRDFEMVDKPYSDFIDRNSKPRMPWHDVGVYIQGMAARDIARHFILRWNHAKEEICPKDKSKPYLMPKCYSKFIESETAFLKDSIGSLFRAECQNQFFISQPGGSGYVYNGIADALFNRILKAYREERDFRVYVVLPLLPAFEGEIGTGSGTLIQAITRWLYKSVCRGPDSLMDRLSRHMKDPLKYIGFYGLRTHGILGNKPVTELVYVHSKILIVDDRVAIIGSANINDRSLLGRRDSEIAVIIRDTNFLDKPHGAGKFCYSLRTALFREHLGSMQQSDQEIDISNPSNLEFFQDVWNKIAASNTLIYEEVFSCLPTDKVTDFGNLKTYLSISELAETDPVTAREKLKKVRGYLVQFPLFFLCDECLDLQATRKEHYLPNSVFT